MSYISEMKPFFNFWNLFLSIQKFLTSLIVNPVEFGFVLIIVLLLQSNTTARYKQVLCLFDIIFGFSKGLIHLFGE